MFHQVVHYVVRIPEVREAIGAVLLSLGVMGIGGWEMDYISSWSS